MPTQVYCDLLEVTYLHEIFEAFTLSKFSLLRLGIPISMKQGEQYKNYKLSSII